MKEYLNFWRSFFDFKGRTTRKGFWMVFLWNIIVSVILAILLLVVSVVVFKITSLEAIHLFEIVYSLYSLLCIVPFASLTVRRLQDAGFSWHAIFWLLIPGVGLIAFLARICARSVEVPEKDKLINSDL